MSPFRPVVARSVSEGASSVESLADASGCKNTQFLGKVALSNQNHRVNSETGEQTMQMTAVFMPVPEGFVGFVDELPGANAVEQA